MRLRGAISLPSPPSLPPLPQLPRRAALAALAARQTAAFTALLDADAPPYPREIPQGLLSLPRFLAFDISTAEREALRTKGVEVRTDIDLLRTDLAAAAAPLAAALSDKNVRRLQRAARAAQREYRAVRAAQRAVRSRAAGLRETQGRGGDGAAAGGYEEISGRFIQTNPADLWQEEALMQARHLSITPGKWSWRPARRVACTCTCVPLLPAYHPPQAQRALAEAGAKLARRRSAARRALGVLQVQLAAAGDPNPNRNPNPNQCFLRTGQDGAVARLGQRLLQRAARRHQRQRRLRRRRRDLAQSRLLDVP